MENYYIYCLYNDELPEYYVGHTKDLKRRFAKHKQKSKNKNYKVYKYINNNGGIDNFKMEVLDKTYCDKQDARKLERYYIELLGASLNSDIPGRIKKEYYNDNKQKISEKAKEYYQNNKEKISEKRKEHRQDNKQQINEQKKEYYQENIEKIKEKQRKWHQNNKQKISEKRKEKFTCICGSVTRKSDQAQHWKTKKHIDFIKENIGY